MKSFRETLLCGVVPSAPESKAEAWRTFMGGGTRHSSAGAMLAELILEAEKQRIPYTLEAHPGHGYHLKRAEEVAG